MSDREKMIEVLQSMFFNPDYTEVEAIADRLIEAGFVMTDKVGKAWKGPFQEWEFSSMMSDKRALELGAVDLFVRKP